MQKNDITPFLSTINRYIAAKDNNKPHLLSQVFTQQATLSMQVNTDGISFPSEVVGRHAISDVLVSQFNQTYENIYTFCLSDSIDRNGSLLACKWLVAMTEKESGNLKVGCGHYDWEFQSEDGSSVKKLSITIKHMFTLDFHNTAHFLHGLSELPYPWCFSSSARIEMPAIPALQDIRTFLDQI
ncbi:nuclear transport factor 2 family protein [Enterovibrio norvegicus]|uniref:Uncharacterized protein n=1 Tax=Enterovibrio norvegicus TaxID=188144 RepID=A0A2N7L8X3_9GAMM|nr:nuclear transport factor 2 family protein [Enterovibrio norvegicus]PML81890.1 hypothetical protein BCT69_00670 [Enterovibrio norvegicus]PMN90780.1 hypothetical protein BCT23_18860 [Enterovibrio norvegicus]